jgi:hypothetical protein
MKKTFVIGVLFFLLACSQQIPTSPETLISIDSPTATVTPPPPTATINPPSPTVTNTPYPPIAGEKPEPRSDAVIAYDNARGVIVVVGGWAGDSKYFYDTWEYDGFNWKKVDIESPGSPLGSNMAFDEERKIMVLYDWDEQQIWEYDGKIWSPIETPNRPIGGSWSAIAYDPTIKKIVLIAERNSGETYETWFYDEDDFELIDSSRPRQNWGMDGNNIDRVVLPGMVFDRKNSEMILQPTYNWTFAFKDNKWFAKVTGENSPFPDCFYFLTCVDNTIVYDKDRDVIVLINSIEVWENQKSGGKELVSKGDSITWEYQDGAWQKIDTPTILPYVGGFSLAYDEARNVVVLFGGVNSDGNFLNDVWEYDGVDWVKR